MAALGLHLVHQVIHPSAALCQLSRAQDSLITAPCSPPACQVREQL